MFHYIVDSEIEKKTIVLYIDCDHKKALMLKLCKWNKFTGEQVIDLNQEVELNTIEDDFDKLFIEHGLMNKCSSMNNAQYNTHNRPALLTSSENHRGTRTQIIID